MDEPQAATPKRLLRVLLTAGILAGAWLIADAVLNSHPASAAGIDEVYPVVSDNPTAPAIPPSPEVPAIPVSAVPAVLIAVAPVIETAAPVTAIVTEVVTPVVAPLAPVIDLLPTRVVSDLPVLFPLFSPDATTTTSFVPATTSIPAPAGVPAGAPADVPTSPAVPAAAASFPVADLVGRAPVEFGTASIGNAVNDDLPSFPFFESDTTPD